MSQFIRIRSPQFQLLEEERDAEFFGKRLAEYLQIKLTERGYDAPFALLEDWGWWVELKGAPFAFGVCIYGFEERDGVVDYAVTDGATGPRQWSWKRFWFVDTQPWVGRLHDDLLAIFEADANVEVVGVTEQFPL